MFILLVEGLERFAYYGVNYTQQSFNIGALIGGLSVPVVPVVVAMNPFAGYMIPVVGEIYYSLTS